ncbi:AAA ATPase midasin [Coemansia sp. RSA 1358]|nr:AAA ATPase midasin [Coemansia sp. RSA 1358]
MPASADQQNTRGSGMGMVKHSLERLAIATASAATEVSALENVDSSLSDQQHKQQQLSTKSIDVSSFSTTLQTDADQPHRDMDECVRITDIDPLSVDLPRAIYSMLSSIDQAGMAIPTAAVGLLKLLRNWADTPKKKAVRDVLNWLSALLLAEGVDRWDAGRFQFSSTSYSAQWIDGMFTIAVAMSFRPILVDLVARWTLPEAQATIFHHILQHTDNTRAHLCVAYASGCLVSTSPQIKSLVMAYFRNHAGSSISQLAVSAYSVEDSEATMQALVISYRLIRKLPEVIGGIESWDWVTPLVSLMVPNSSQLIRLLSCECLCLVKLFSDQGKAKLLESLQLDSSLVARTIAWLVNGERAFDEDAAKQMVAVNLANFKHQLWKQLPCDNHPWITDDLLSSCVANVGGVLLHAHKSAAVPTGLVLTPMVLRNIHEMALATSRSEPVLLQGPIGSGKTSLVEWVAQRTGNELVTIHLSSNMDAKVLLGNYVTTQKAGDFEWRPGLLTAAVTQGQWVLIENIDLAPSDVIQTLVPLLESHTLFVANRGENISAHIQFRLFATLSASGRSSVRSGVGGLLGSSIWTRLNIESLELEVPLIVAGVFSSLSPHAEMIAQSFSKISTSVVGGQAAGAAAINRSVFMLSTSDLIKWCTRLNKYFTNDGFLLFQEAIDTFTMREPDYEKWRALVHRIGAIFGISRHRVDQFIDQHNPFVSVTGNVLKIGRASLAIDGSVLNDRMPFADTHHSRCLLERIATCVQLAEPTLLLGETGTGKTTVVQHLATLAGRSLSVFNLSQQSDSSDLLGGFRPVDISLIALRLRETFDHNFGRTFSIRKNAAFLDKVRVAYGKKDWKRLVGLFQASVAMAKQVIDKARNAAGATEREQATESAANEDKGDDNGEHKRKKPRLSVECADELEAEWQEFQNHLTEFDGLKCAKMIFSFVEGALVKAARSGGWILLDEINLATAETLACLGGLLQKERSLLLAETGVRIPCHPGFRLFACMNPSNDVGKRDLPPGLRSSFTEFFVHPPDNNNDDLLSIIRSHLPSNVPSSLCHRVIDFYRSAKRLAGEHRLVDGANQRPHYSLRTLTRSLTYARENAQAYSLKRALYDGLYMTFITQLESNTQAVLVSELHKIFAGDDLKQLLIKIPPCRLTGESVLVQSFWLPKLGDDADQDVADGYVITSSVEAKIKSLARAVMCGRYPVLIQGPTSAGKTSMVQYLARKTGHKFVRINNHEHTDLQEYLGSYTSVDGKLVFEEGLLVKALRHGHWLVLDELNLAPSDVLEALNRLLDDNRELVIPETQEIVRPHPHFMLFATQNPAGLYGGRKALSRAFRNRFVELHFDDIPEKELQQIIVDSCQVPPTHARLLVDVYRNLTQVRAQMRIFEASHGFITLRDLFRWANRHATTKDELAEHGYMLLAERVRSDDEKIVVRRAIERAFYSKSSEANAHVKRGIDVERLYSETRLREMPEFQAFEQQQQQQQNSLPIAWTKAMRRLFILTALCLRFHEPVLLVGETGCGKTTVCQMLASARSQQLHIVNCHQNTESSDILGGQRPVRNRNTLIASAHDILVPVCGSEALAGRSIDTPDALREFVEQWRSSSPAAQETIATHSEQLDAAYGLLARSQDLFAWHDGPLVQAMKQGDMFLMDELNLADDSVLERLNSVLEPSRTLVLAENIGASALTAHDDFEFAATMNPGGDYGKRELSPALRNRFTELWAPTTTDADDLRLILGKWLYKTPEADISVDVILKFVAFLRDEQKVLQHPLSLRDYLFWAEFIVKTYGLMDARNCVVHGACLVLLDSIGTQGSSFSISTRLPAAVKADCVTKLREMVEWQAENHDSEFGVVPARQLMNSNPELELATRVLHKQGFVGVAPFFVEKGKLNSFSGEFALHAPTTFDNLVKILRAMQVGKPLLLEGSPGVGKTTLVSTLAKLAGHHLVRINLSDQTDLMDLFGTDLPVDDGFAWCDAPFLQALKQGDWVLLDEINLASQSVLEGLNSCLDHRGTVYISELDREFTLSPGFRLFAAQNPLGQGGGRKGLPRSFINRFTQVYMDELSREDLKIICDNIYSGHSSIERVIDFNCRMHYSTMTKRLFGVSGSPWEFNLRDVSRFMELALQPSLLEQGPKPIEEFIEMLYVHRMRTRKDREYVLDLYHQVFGRQLQPKTPSLHITERSLQVGNAVLPRKPENSRVTRLLSLHSQLPYMESLMKCIEMRWMAILVGPAGSGKTSLVRWLANATGNKLVEFAMNSGVDTSDILGGFEQMDMQRHRTGLLRNLARLVDRAILDWSCLSNSNEIALACSLYQKARQCASTQDLCAVAEHFLATFKVQIEESPSFIELATIVQREVRVLLSLEVAGKFEWVDGVLVEALLNGYWLLIDRANLCSASVLDRLNGLLEPNGVLYVNEDPKRTEAIVPHKNFRIIMAVDPQYGELSRAMRNRGIEICMLPSESSVRQLSDQMAVAKAIGLCPSLLPADMAPKLVLTDFVQQSVHTTERIQRGYVAQVDSTAAQCSEMLVTKYMPGPLDSVVSVACWQARLANHAENMDDSLQRMRMLLAVISTIQPDPEALGLMTFKSILQSDLANALLESPLMQQIVNVRGMLAVECGIDGDILAAAPVYPLLNHSLHRALQRYSDWPVVRWHQALLDTLLFQRERLAVESTSTIDNSSIRDFALQRSNVDVSYMQQILDLIGGCEQIISGWDTFVSSSDAMDILLTNTSVDLSQYVPVLHSLHALKLRIQTLLSLETGAASRLAVAFEGAQSALVQLTQAPSVVGQLAEGVLGIAQCLVLDASYSTKVWSLAHPTILSDQTARELEAKLLKTQSAINDNPDLREAIVEALAMLYATVSHKDRTLIVNAVARFVGSLPQLESTSQSATSTAAAASPLAPADVLADVRDLSRWRRILCLALLSSMFNTSSPSLQKDILADLCHEVNGMAVSTILDSPADRLRRPVATELTLKQAACLDCSLDDNERTKHECQDLLRLLTTYKPSNCSASSELSALVGFILQAIRVVADINDQAAFTLLSEKLVSALATSNTSSRIVDEWYNALVHVAAPITELISYAAETMRTALKTQSLIDVYAAWIETNMCLMAISIPKRNVDPAAKAHTQWEWLGEDVDISKADFVAYKFIQRNMTGDEDTIATQPFSQRLADLESQHAAIELVYRPQQSTLTAGFVELWQEAHNLCSSIFKRIRDLYIRMLTSEIATESFNKLQAAVYGLLGTLDQFENRVRSRYFDTFRDVAQIWCMYARQIGYGLAQMAEAKRIEVNQRQREYAQLTAELYAHPICSGVPATHKSNMKMQKTLIQLKTLIYFTSENSNPLKEYSELLVTLLMRTVFGVQVRGQLSPADLEAIDIIFRDAYEIHKRAIDEKRRRDAEAASLFKSKMTAEQTDDELLQDIFPGYEDIYDSIAGEGGNSDSNNCEQEPSYTDIPEETLATIAVCHQYLMLQFGITTCSQDIRNAHICETQQQSFKLAASLYNLRPDIVGLQPGSADAALRGANMVALAAVITATNSGSDAGADMNSSVSGIRFTQVPNFYKDAWPSEALRLKPLASAIAKRAQGLLDEWPDHAVLQHIRDMSCKLLKLPVTTPLAKLLSGLELLHERAQDWEAYASRDVSIQELAEAARLIIRWRQAELNSWPHLLHSQELEFARRPNQWWFNLYASLLAQEGVEFPQLVGAIDQFIQGSPAGEFRGRLNTLYAFAAHRLAIISARALQEEQPISVFKQADTVYGPLLNAIDYYMQYVPCIADHLSRAKQAIKKDLAQYVKISTWKDVNPAALRASAQKTHRHLTKCIKRWQEVLSQPIFQIIQAYQTSNITTAKVPQVQIILAPLDGAGIEVASVALMSGAPVSGSLPWLASGLEVDSGAALTLAKAAKPAIARILEMSPSTLQQLSKLMSKSTKFGQHGKQNSTNTDALEDFAVQAVGDINYFQNIETPKHLLKKPTKTPNSESSIKTAASKKKKLIIKGKKQQADEDEEENEYIEDDDERQRKIKQFWGEQRNLRRTRLKEILKGLQDIGLKRHFRPTSADGEDDTKTAELSSSALTGISSILRQSPLDVSAWHAAISVSASADPKLVHAEVARTLRNWQLANSAFFKFTSQLAQLRTATFEEHSQEISSQQIQHITGLMESLNHNASRDRRCAAELVSQATSWMQMSIAWSSIRSEPDKSNVFEFDNNASTTICDIKSASDNLTALFSQLFASVRLISSAGGWGQSAEEVSQVVARLSTEADQFTKALALLNTVSTFVVSLELASIKDSVADTCLSVFKQVKAAKKAVSQAAHSIQKVLIEVSESNMGLVLLEPWLDPISKETSCILAMLSASDENMDVDDTDIQEAATAATTTADIDCFADLIGRWVTAVMNVWQSIHSAEQQYVVSQDPETNMWGLAPKELVRRLELMQGMAHALHLPTMLELCHKIVNTTSKEPILHSASWQHVVDNFVKPWVLQYSLIVQHVVAMHAECHKILMQFALTIATALTSVIVHGLGSNDIYDSEETDESMQNGTGMGEGSTAGAKNVSDEIEGEDQVEGLKGDEPADDKNEPNANEDAIDMENDFEGKLGDADLETDDENSDDDKSDSEDEQDMDEQMGDVDPTDPTSIDEKLWDDEDEADDKDKDGKGDDSKIDSKAQKKKEQADIVAGDDQDSGNDSDDGDKDAENKDGEQADGSDAEDDNNNEFSDGSGSDEGEGEEDDDDDDLDDRINKDTLDRMADVDDLGEQLEMPDELDISDMDDEEDDGLEADMDDDLPEDEPIEQKPDAMDEDNAEQADNDGKDDTVEGEDGERVDNDNVEASDGEEQQGEDGDAHKEDGDSNDEDEEAGQSGDENADEEVEDGHENALIDEDAEKEEKENAGADKPTNGIDSAMNLDGNDDADPNTTAESQDTLAKPSEMSSSNSQNKSDSKSAQQESFAPDLQSSQNEDQQQHGEDDRKRNMDTERTLADVIEKWERRLNIVMREDEPQEENIDPDHSEGAKNNKEDESNANQKDEQPAAPESSEFEHVKEDENFDKVALADANDDELEKQQHQPMDIDEEEDAKQQQQDDSHMQGEDADDMDQDNSADDQKASAAQTKPLQNEPRAQPHQPPTESKADSLSDAAQMQQATVDKMDDSGESDSEDDKHTAEDDEATDHANKIQQPIDVEKLRGELEERTAEWRASSQDSEQAMQLWQSYTRLTHDLSLMLTEQLRLILTPTQATQLKGDYRTGKRLNMKRIIPYIASEFRKDKIWLRRTKPARREYQVMVSLDNSKSMAQTTQAVELAYETLALITTALNQLEVGQISIVSFGEQVNLLHPFDSPFDSEAGARVLSQFTFADDKTDAVQMMDASLQLFEAAAAASAASDLWRLQLVISDGVCQDHARLLRQVRAAMEQRVMIVFIVLDRSAISTNAEAVDPEKDSIMNTQHVSFVKGLSGKMEMRVERYLDTFPFKYYVVLRNIHGLPAVLAETLRQYFSIVGNE